ncbi:MAG TPA: PQQ-binding-like beta-propeller repeat protein [Chthonomonadales bacterium]|nr:PQQ-binding-like beta-propeller repeat protein [Chthonomonadales bacterium]
MALSCRMGRRGTVSVCGRLVLAGAALGFPFASSSAVADSAMFRGGAGLTGSYEGRLDIPVALSWRYTAPYSPAASANPSSPAVRDGVVYFSVGDRVFAVAAESGELRWRFPQDEALSSIVRTSLAVANGTVFFGDTDGNLTALNAATGATTWKFAARANITASPVVADGVVYFGTADGRLFALNAATGTDLPLWRGGLRLADEVIGAPAVADGTVFALTADGSIAAVGAATGRVRAQVRLGGSVRRQAPVVRDGLVYVAAGARLSSLLARNLAARRWSVNLPDDIAVAPAVSERALIAVTTDNRVFSLDPLSGRALWTVTPRLEQDVAAPPTIVGDVVVIGTNRGLLYALDIATGATRWLYALAPTSTRPDAMVAHVNVAAAPVVANGALIVAADDASVSVFRADSVDTTEPYVTDLLPQRGVVINGAPPIRFEGILRDDGSGIRPDSLRLLINGEPVAMRPPGPDNRDRPGFSFDLLTGRLEYDTPEPVGAALVRPLPDGRHEVALQASDWKGNNLDLRWRFTVDNSVRRTGRRETRRQDGATPGRPGSTLGPGVGSGGMAPGGRGRGGRRSGGGDL